MVLMIDNYDSFTYNIVQYFKELGADLKVIRNDEMTVEQIEALNPEKIVISPGPSTPNEAGVSLEVIKKLGHKIPILGICLGHQAIGQAFGGTVDKAPNMMHGKTSTMKVCADSPLFKDMPKEFTATRYHSLIVKKDNLPSCIIPTAYSADDDEIMALQIEGSKIYGVQFHPESVLSHFGHEIFKNFLEL
ncbi:MAG: aminodeoxychorismate/anthranilate synthase component II [Campylobacterales bacterium]|nr:aminodeoxychorismate/anthranilate synthase component II [Campylobacterales bacterium]